MTSYREYLMEKFIRLEHPRDDSIPDEFGDWIDRQDNEDLIDWADKWALQRINTPTLVEKYFKRGFDAGVASARGITR